MIPINACTLRITAAAGTELAGASFGGTVKPSHYSHEGVSSPLTEVYDPRTFIPHAASLRQAFAHCAIFPTAASRRSLDRVPVPVWPVILSDRLPIVALVGRYPANKLMGRIPILYQLIFICRSHAERQTHPVLNSLSGDYPGVKGRLDTRYSPVRRSPSNPAKLGPCCPSTCMC